MLRRVCRRPFLPSGTWAAWSARSTLELRRQRACATATHVQNNAQGFPDIRFGVDQPAATLPDAFALVAHDVKRLGESMIDLVEADAEMPDSSRQVLEEGAQHFFQLGGKSFRPTIALLVASAAGGAADERQERLAQIIEMIHAASLLHDDVIDLAGTRRGQPAAHLMVGNKVAVLSGDFLLARATRLLAELGDNEVVELMARVIDEMVAGEMMQAKSSAEERLSFEYYMSKTYRKTAALISLGCESVAVLGGHTPAVRSAARRYGQHLGLAYQLIDDMLDITGSSDALGKPAGSDMSQGLATAPALFAYEEFDEIGPLITRRFSEELDVAKACELIHRSKGIERTAQLATNHAQQAAEALGVLPPSEARDALLRLLSDVLTRKA